MSKRESGCENIIEIYCYYYCHVYASLSQRLLNAIRCTTFTVYNRTMPKHSAVYLKSSFQSFIRVQRKLGIEDQGGTNKFKLYATLERYLGCRGVNPGGDGGDTSPPIFRLGGTNI